MRSSIRPELDEGLAFRQSIPPDLMALLRDWALGFCPLNTIERAVSDLIDTRAPNARAAHRGRRDRRRKRWRCSSPVTSWSTARAVRSLLRDHLTPGSDGADGGSNTLNFRLEYALVITFLYGQKYDCNEYCKYYKNVENARYKFIPTVQRTHYDGNVSHVTGIVNITAEDYEAMPSQIRR